MENIHFCTAQQQSFKNIVLKYLDQYFSTNVVKCLSKEDQQLYQQVKDILTSDQSEQFIGQINVITQGNGYTYYCQPSVSVIFILEQNRVIAMYRTINYNKYYLNQETLYLYYHDGVNNDIRQDGELQIISCSESQICTNYNIGKYMGFCSDYYFIVCEQQVRIYEQNTPNMIFQEIPIQNPQFDNVQIKINAFNNEVIINLVSYKNVISVLMTISIFNQIDPTIPSLCNPDLAKKQGYFRENGFILAGYGKHQCLLYLLNYTQNGRYMAVLRPKNGQEKVTLQNIEEKQTETTEDRLWAPVNYYQDQQFKHFCELYQCRTDSQYLANKLRLVNQDFVWLIEPYVLGNPHEVIYMKDRIDPLNKHYVVPNQQPNENIFMIQINSTVQVYQHSGYLWSLAFELNFKNALLSINVSTNKILISALENGMLLLLTYRLQTIFANNHNQLARQADQITLVTDLNKNILPHPYYNYGVNSSEILVNSQIINDKIIQLTQNSLLISEILHNITNMEESDTKDYNLNGFTAYEEQQSINKQNLMEEELKKKQQEQKADMEDGYDLCLDRDVEDLFRNDYYYIDQEETNYSSSVIKAVSFDKYDSNIIPIGLLYNQMNCYCILYSVQSGFQIGYFSDERMENFVIEPLNCQQITDYQNVLQSIIIKYDHGIYIKGQNHDIYFKGIYNSIKDVSQINILLNDINGNLMLYNFVDGKYVYLKYFSEQFKSTNYKTLGQSSQHNQTLTQVYKLEILTIKQITDYLNTDQNKYVIVLTTNNYLIAFDKQTGIQQYGCKVHINSKLVSAYLNNQITLQMRWGLLETRTPSTIQEHTLIDKYLNKEYEDVKDILNQSRIPLTYIPYRLHFVQLITQKSQQKQSFDLDDYFKFVTIVLEQKHYDLTSTAQFLLHNNLSDKQADNIPDYACFNLIYEYCFMMQFLLYLLNIKLTEITTLDEFLNGLTNKFSISEILENDVYKINHNYLLLQYIYDNFTIPYLKSLNDNVTKGEASFRDEKTAQLTLQVLYWLTSHQISLFFNAQNKFALEQELKRTYLQFYILYKQLGYINVYVKYVNIYSDINQIFKLLPRYLTQQASDDLMIGLEEINQQLQLLDGIEQSSYLTQLYAQLINIMSFQGYHKLYQWKPNMEYIDMLLQDGINVLQQIIVQQFEKKDNIQVQILQQINNLLFCDDNDKDILTNVIKELYQQLSNKTLLQSVVEQCYVKYKLEQLKALDVNSYLLEFIYGNQKSRNDLSQTTVQNTIVNQLEKIFLSAKTINGEQSIELLNQYMNSKTDPEDLTEYQTMIALIGKVANKQNIKQVIDVVQTWLQRSNINETIEQLKTKVQTIVKNKQLYCEKKSRIINDFNPYSDQQWKKMEAKEVECKQQIQRIQETIIPILSGVSKCCSDTLWGLIFLGHNL